MELNKLVKQFRFGFEIEGLFYCSLVNELQRIADKKGYDLECKNDSSVDVYPDGRKDEAEKWGIYKDERRDEIAIGIFRNFNEMIKALKLFENGKNYLENKSCGLHIHLSTKNNELKNRVADYQFIKKLQKWAEENLCERVKERLVGDYTTYCKCYTSFKETYRRWKYQEKYRFLCNHSQGTFEFRFFSPCEHKVVNVKKFFTYFFDELKKMGNGKGKIIKLEDNKQQYNFVENFKLEKDKMTMKIKI